jgi:hypothetical protein
LLVSRNEARVGNRRRRLAKGGITGSRRDIHAGLRAEATGVLLRGGTCFLSSLTLRRSASMRLITRPGVANLGLRS